MHKNSRHAAVAANIVSRCFAEKLILQKDFILINSYIILKMAMTGHRSGDPTSLILGGRRTESKVWHLGEKQYVIS